MNSKKPLPPEPDKIEQQYGDDADLYAEVRADVAEALGRTREAKKWDEVKEQIDQPDDSQQP